MVSLQRFTCHDIVIMSLIEVSDSKYTIHYTITTGFAIEIETTKCDYALSTCLGRGCRLFFGASLTLPHNCFGRMTRYFWKCSPQAVTKTSAFDHLLLVSYVERESLRLHTLYDRLCSSTPTAIFLHTAVPVRPQFSHTSSFKAWCCKRSNASAFSCAC